jgi:hypothetical protein
MEHVSDVELEQLLDETLPLVKKTFVKLHLKGCPVCQGRMAKQQEERHEFEAIIAVARKLEEADRKSTQATHLMVTKVFQPTLFKQ